VSPHAYSVFSLEEAPTCGRGSSRRLENPCYKACFTILVLNRFMNMPPGQNRFNFAFRNGFLRLATMPTAQSGLKLANTEA